MNPITNNFMNRLIKTILIVLTAVFGTWFLLAPFANATVIPLIVEYWSETENNWLPLSAPIFSETNFLPGGNVTRLVRVINNSGATQRIATQPLNITDPNHLGDVLNLVIKEGATTLYNNALSTFLANGEAYLSNLANGANTQYDFTVSFYSGTQNTFQGKSLGFDILIGFQGTEGGILPGAGSTSGYGGGGGGGGGGGWLPPGLTIQNEATATTTDTSVTISWETSYPASSQIIYAKEGEKHTLDLTDSTGTPPKYGYERTTPEYDISPKTTFHSVTINGLTPGTKYYYRNVSHASLAIGQEYSFITLRSGEIQKPEEEISQGINQGEISDGIAMVSPEINVAVNDAVKGAVDDQGENSGTQQAGYEFANLATIWKGIGGLSILIIALILLIIILAVLILNKRAKNQ